MSSIAEQIRSKIETGIPGASAVVQGGDGGHFMVSVTAAQFKGLNTLKKQQMVYATFKELMDGPTAPVHAIDRMETHVPDDA